MWVRTETKPGEERVAVVPGTPPVLVQSSFVVVLLVALRDTDPSASCQLIYPVCALSAEDVAKLLKAGFRVVVEKSPHRCIP